MKKLLVAMVCSIALAGCGSTANTSDGEVASTKKEKRTKTCDAKSTSSRLQKCRKSSR